MKIWRGYDWDKFISSNDLGRIYCDNGELHDAYHTLIDGEHIFLLEISISKNWMKENDENMTELELKSFWYKSHKKSIFTKMDLVISFSVLNRFWWTKDPIEGNKRGHKGV